MNEQVIVMEFILLLCFNVKHAFQSQDGQPRAEVLMLEMDVRDDMVALLRPHLFRFACGVVHRLTYGRLLHKIKHEVGIRMMVF